MIRTLKLIGDFLFGKIPVVSYAVITTLFIKWMDTKMFISGHSEFQMFAGLMAIITTLLAFLFMSRFVEDRKWKIFNLVSGMLIIACGFLLLKDLKSRPFQYEPYENPTYLTQSKSDRIIIEGNGIIGTFNKSDVKFDSLNPLVVYKCFRIDCFGKKTSSHLCLKSNLMKDYYFPKYDRER